MKIELPLQQVPLRVDDAIEVGGPLESTRRYVVEATAASAWSAQVLASKLRGGELTESGPQRLIVEVDDEREVLELEYEETDAHGRRSEFTVLASPKHLRPADRTTRASDEVAWSTHLLRPGTSADRGISSVLKALNIFKLAETGERAVAAVASKFEDRLIGGDSSLRYCPSPNELGPAVAEGSLDRSQPILLLLHGTASSCAHSFGDLAGTSEWQELSRKYGRNAIAFEHRTLTHSPIQNAMDVLSALPEGACLHLLSHSRGGLVGELLCLASAGVSHGELATSGNIAGEMEKLLALGRDRKIHVERFLRCACPARGTPLMSSRLDTWASLFLTGLGYVFRGNPIFDLTRKLLLQLVGLRTDSKTLPGLACMSPNSPLLHYVNTQRLPTGELAVIAGDARRPGLLGRLRTLLVDAFFRDQNDLIVDTDSMYGGAVRPNTYDALFQDTASTPVNHFVYFRMRDVRARALEYLSGETKSFEKLPSTEPPESRDRLTLALEALGAGDALTQPRRRTTGPIVVIVPGIMGSHLRLPAGRVWLNFWALRRGGMADLKVGSAVTAEGLIAGAYARLTKYLEAHGRDVVLFPFDWRSSLRVAATQLARQLNALRSVPARPIRLLGHSMGGLVVRVLMAQDPRLWRALVQEHDCRLVMLGTPNAGSHTIAQLFSDQHPLLKTIAFIDSRNDSRSLTQVTRKFAGPIQMLPEQSGVDFFSAGFWDDVQLPPVPANSVTERVPADELLEARTLRASLKEKGVDSARMVYVAGLASYTPSHVAWENSALKFSGTRAGDGTVTWASGALPNVKTYYAQAEHGDLPDLPNAFEAYLDLLERGVTSRLPDKPPRGAERGSSGAEEERLPQPDWRVDLFPGVADLEDLALGRAPRSRFAPAESQVQIAVAHADARAIWEFRNEQVDEFGDPRTQQSSMLIVIGVGHGEGPPYPEAALDALVSGGIGHRLAVGSLTGRLGSRSVVRSEIGEGPHVLVLGLGEPRDVTTDSLTEALSSALLDACLDASLCEPDPGGVRRLRPTLALSRMRRAGLSETDLLTVGLQGVVLANRRLRQQGLWDVVRIDRVLFTENFEEDAIGLLHAAREAETSPPFALERGESFLGPRLLITPTKLEMELPRRPLSDGQERPWDTWSIMRPNPTVLKLSANIRRARAEADSHPFNPAVVARFVSQLTTTSTPDDEAVSYLRGHLLPDTFRIAFEQSRNILLSLDRETAPIPWEMFLIDVNAENSAPSARLSMVRQLEEAKASSLPDVTAQHRALVVGPPDLSEDPSFPLLPRAEAEAQHVKELLRANGYDVRPEAVNGLAGDAIRRAHAGSGYSIVHLCGHGQVDEADPSRTGLVLANGDTFSALDLRTWPAIPALVFFNCCHLARMQPRLAHDHPGRLAASLARACIQSGVRVVVAAGWAVNDAAAEAFARTFYERMLNGEMFGAAVANARMAAWRAAPRTLTWAAYQCYGDPHFVLPRIPTDGGVVTRRDGETLSSRRELEDFIREMTLRAYRHGRDHRGNAAAREELTQVAERVVRGVPDGLWNGRLLHKMALLWQQLGKDELAMPAFSLAATYRDAPIALARERELVTRSRNRTQSSSATTVPSEVGVAQQAVDTSQLLAPADLVDQVVIACGRGEHQLASELFAKLDAALLARPLGGIEAMALPERALLLAMWPTLRAQGLQSPPVTSLEDVAAQYATMLESATQTTRLAADRRLADMSSWVGDEKKSMIDELRERLAGIGDQDDPNKGLFGGESTRDGLTMKVAFPPNQKDQGWVRFTLSVEAVSANRPLQGDVVFFLHPSFNEPKVVIPAANNRAEYTDLAWGAFTAGAEVGTTRLELDLAEAPDAPSPFKDR